MTTIAIIPARGGSKRIPRKNIRPFLDRPIIAYSIRAAQQSALFDDVMVSTDDDEIAAIAEFYGASVPFRRSALNANDNATTADVLVEVLACYAERGQAYTFGCCLYPTAPFVTSTLLKEGWKLLIEDGFDSVFPVLRYSFPIYRSVKLENNRVNMIWPDHLSTRSQDLPIAYHDAGQFYWFRSDALQQKGALWTDNSGGFVIPEMLAHDIDTDEDWAIAEFKYQFASRQASK